MILKPTYNNETSCSSLSLSLSFSSCIRRNEIPQPSKDVEAVIVVTPSTIGYLHTDGMIAIHDSLFGNSQTYSDSSTFAHSTEGYAFNYLVNELKIGSDTVQDAIDIAQSVLHNVDFEDTSSVGSYLRAHLGSKQGLAKYYTQLIYNLNTISDTASLWSANDKVVDYAYGAYPSDSDVDTYNELLKASYRYWQSNLPSWDPGYPSSGDKWTPRMVGIVAADCICGAVGAATSGGVFGAFAAVGGSAIASTIN